ncbi:MAG: hypothetical protein U0414_19915 [Polyangiaceae bacterium]
MLKPERTRSSSRENPIDACSPVAPFTSSPMKSRGVVAGLASLALWAAGCGKASFDVKAEAGRVEDGDWAQHLWVTVTSSPKARIVCKPRCGEYQSDADGLANFPIRLEPQAGTYTFEFTATEDALFGKSKSTTLTFEYKANVSAKTKENVTTIQCGAEKCEGSIPWQTEAALLLAGSGLERVELGTAVQPVNGQVRVPIGNAIGDMPLSVLTGHMPTVSVDLPLKLTFKSGAVAEAKVSAEVPPSALERGLGGAARTPIVYAGEDAGDPRLKAILFFDTHSSSVLGTAKTFRDVDAIAFTSIDKHEIKCGKYNAGSLGTLDVVLDAIDLDVEVYRRRTSKLLAKKHFVAARDCPSSYTTENGAAGRFLASMVPDNLIKEWVTAQLKAK